LFTSFWCMSREWFALGGYEVVNCLHYSVLVVGVKEGVAVSIAGVCQEKSLRLF